MKAARESAAPQPRCHPRYRSDPRAARLPAAPQAADCHGHCGGGSGAHTFFAAGRHCSLWCTSGLDPRVPSLLTAAGGAGRRRDGGSARAGQRKAHRYSVAPASLMRPRTQAPPSCTKAPAPFASHPSSPAARARRQAGARPSRHRAGHRWSCCTACRARQGRGEACRKRPRAPSPWRSAEPSMRCRAQHSTKTPTPSRVSLRRSPSARHRRWMATGAATAATAAAPAKQRWRLQQYDHALHYDDVKEICADVCEKMGGPGAL